MNENNKLGVDVHTTKNQLGIGIVYYPYPNDDTRHGNGRCYPMRGILRGVIPETNTLLVRFVIGRVGMGHYLQAFDMPVSAELCKRYEMWTKDELELLQSEIGTMPTDQILESESTRYPEFSGDLREGDVVFLIFNHQGSESKHLRMLPLPIKKLTKTRIFVGGFKFRRKLTQDARRGSMVSDCVGSWQIPSSNFPAFQNNLEMRLVSHTTWMMSAYARTLSSSNYADYVARVRVSK